MTADSDTRAASPIPAWLVIVARVLLVLVLALLVAAVLSPSNATQFELVLRAAERLRGLGLPPRVAAEGRLEVVANVAIVVPVGVLGSLAFPRLRWQDWAAYAFLAALGVELAQGLLLPARMMSATDVVANTLGALLGAWLVVVVSAGWRLRKR